jgi:hypothetical protein
VDHIQHVRSIYCVLQKRVELLAGTVRLTSLVIPRLAVKMSLRNMTQWDINCVWEGVLNCLQTLIPNPDKMSRVILCIVCHTYTCNSVYTGYQTVYVSYNKHRVGDVQLYFFWGLFGDVISQNRRGRRCRASNLNRLNNAYPGIILIPFFKAYFLLP